MGGKLSGRWDLELETQKINERKMVCEAAIVERKNDIVNCFNFDSFNECKSYIVNNFICKNAFPDGTLLYKFASDKDVAKLTCASLINNFTK